MITDDRLKYVFWGPALVGLAAIAYTQYEAGTEGDRAIIATGMTPQIELMRGIADQSGWKVTCEGTSGEMTALRIAPGFWADDDVEDTMFERIREVSSTTSVVSGTDAGAPNCNVAAPEISFEDSDEPTALAFGTLGELEPFIAIARSCGFEDLAVAPISEFYRELMQTDGTADLQALYLGPESEERYGAIHCYITMAHRHEAAIDSNP